MMYVSECCGNVQVASIPNGRSTSVVRQLSESVFYCASVSSDLIGGVSSFIRFPPTCRLRGLMNEPTLSSVVWTVGNLFRRDSAQSTNDNRHNTTGEVIPGASRTK